MADNKEFNYCFWAKMLVGFPAIFILVFAVSWQFSDPILQILSGAATGVLAVYLAMKIDRHPKLQGKIRKIRKL
jgi:uncharacterized integral membrane protein